LKDEDSWLGGRGIGKREELAKKIEEKNVALEVAVKKAEEDRLALEAENTDRTRVGIFDPSNQVVEANLRRMEEMRKIEDEGNLDPRVGVFYRNKEKSGSWFSWMTWKTGEQRQVEVEQSKQSKDI
jgi:hypothetical protein